MTEKYYPSRGDIIWLNFNPQVGSEQSGKRPALVLSPKQYNLKTGLAIVCPITSKIKGYPFEVVLPDQLSVNGVVLSDHIKSLDWYQRSAEFICQSPSEVLEEVLAKALTLIS